MLQIERSNQFKKDVKRALRRGKDPEKLKHVLDDLIDGKSLPAKFRDHKLVGEYAHCRECHLEPDWLLIYTLTPDTLRLERTGSHSDLFDS
jgi:mRNA interferase YafQ